MRILGSLSVKCLLEGIAVNQPLACLPLVEFTMHFARSLRESKVFLCDSFGTQLRGGAHEGILVSQSLHCKSVVLVLFIRGLQRLHEIFFGKLSLLQNYGEVGEAKTWSQWVVDPWPPPFKVLRECHRAFFQSFGGTFGS